MGFIETFLYPVGAEPEEAIKPVKGFPLVTFHDLVEDVVFGPHLKRDGIRNVDEVYEFREMLLSSAASSEDLRCRSGLGERAPYRPRKVAVCKRGRDPWLT